MEGFCLVLLETPPRLQVCFDNLTLAPGELFKGVRNIPFGPHVLCTNLKQGKSSVFVFANKPEVFVFKWSGESEEYSRLDSETEAMYESSLVEFLPMMVQYDKKSLGAWQELTHYIAQDTINRIQPLSHQILSSSKEYDSDPESLESFNSKQLLYYTTVPSRYTKPNMTPAELTRHNYDKSQILADLLNKEFLKPESLFAEFQFAFVSFLIGENCESFEQWKNLLVLLCNCEQALLEIPSLFIEFIPVLYNQVKNLPKDLIFDPFLSASFITSSLKSFVSMLQDTNLPAQLYQRGCKLYGLLQSEFGIVELEMLDEEEAPVIVE